MPSSYSVVPHAVSVSAGIIVAVPLELLASPLRSGRDLGDRDRSALVALAGDLALVPWARPWRAASARSAGDWRRALGPAPLEELRDLVLGSAWREPLDYAGFLVYEGRTFGSHEYKMEMQDQRQWDPNLSRLQMRFVSNLFFAPSDIEAKLRAEIDAFLTREDVPS